MNTCHGQKQDEYVSNQENYYDCKSAAINEVANANAKLNKTHLQYGIRGFAGIQ